MDKITQMVALDGSQEIGLDELRDNQGEVMSQVLLGKKFVITRYRRPFAELIPLPKNQLSLGLDGPPQ